jgi:Protein of unknown function (DUF3800)
MRLLYLDDSGKANPKDESKFLVYGGLSLDATNWAEFHRRVTGLKAATFPKRGYPNDWELKSKDFLVPNSWTRERNREFCASLIKILDATERAVVRAR